MASAAASHATRRSLRGPPGALSSVLLLIALMVSCAVASGSPTKQQQQQPHRVNLRVNEGNVRLPEGSPSSADLSKAIQTMYGMVVASQYSSTQNLSLTKPQEIKGLFPSFIHVNFHGDETDVWMRQHLAGVDNNQFVTQWILQLLLEVEDMGFVEVGEDVLSLALDTILQFRDRNMGRNELVTNPIFDFWLQTLNVSSGMYESFPDNLVFPLDDVTSFLDKDLEPILEKFLPSVWKEVEGVLGFAETALKAFRIPADFDDTSVNLAMGHLLGVNHPSLHSQWASAAFNMTRLSQAMLSYAYQPFSNDTSVNSIDPRTYFWLRDFLQSRTPSDTFRLIPTWVLNLDEDFAGFDAGVAMPFNANNVDASVSANALFGLTTALVMGNGTSESDWFSADMQALYLNTADLLAFVVDSESLLSRPDLVLLYYPPVYDFYWMSARSLFLLNNPSAWSASNSLLKGNASSTLDTARDTLQDALQGNGTAQILSMATVDNLTGAVYWDDFLGNNDTKDGATINNAEDRLFSTAVALSALIDIWTMLENGTSANQSQRCWQAGVPSEVKSMTNASITWLSNEILADNYLPENAFFSGSMKGMAEFPFIFPANRFGSLNASEPTPNPYKDPSPPGDRGIVLVEGIMDEAAYASMLNGTIFGFEVPVDFPGYNSGGGFPFPYWSAPVLTYAVTMNLFAKYIGLMAC